MRTKLYQYKILVSDIVLAVMVIAAVAFITFWQTRRANETAARVRNTLEVLFHKEILASLATDHETASRAYLLTKRPEFLETYQRARKAIPGEIAALRRLTTRSDRQRHLADSLSLYFDQRSRFVDGVIARYTLEAQDAVSLLITGKGKEHTDRIRQMLTRFHAEENELYNRHFAENQEAIVVQNRLFIGVVCLVALAIVWFSWREKRRIIEQARVRANNLLVNERRFRALVENNENIIALIDERLNTSYRSPASERITGWSPKERDEMAIGEQNHPEDMQRLRETMKQVMAHPGGTFPVSMRTRHKSGRWIWLEGYLTNKYNDPDIGAIVANLRDVTEERRVREELARLNEELEEKVAKRTDELQAINNDMEAFTYSVSHDLRAPLRIINGFTVILEEDYAPRLDAEGKRITSVIKKNTTKMGALIDGLLDFSRLRLQDVNKSPINTRQMVEDIIRNVTENGHRRIEWLVGDLPQSLGDIGSMRQVWTNLISNAVKYSGTREKPHIEIGSFRTEEGTVFFVKDNGVGFDTNYKEKLFKVFQRLHSADEFEGTGIGLAVVHKVVSKHGGKVWAEGEVNEGAAFYFRLPDA